MSDPGFEQWRQTIDAGQRVILSDFAIASRAFIRRPHRFGFIERVFRNRGIMCVRWDGDSKVQEIAAAYLEPI